MKSTCPKTVKRPSFFSLFLSIIHGEIFSSIIGYTGKINPEELKSSAGIYSITDYVGKNGIEKTYEEVLRRNPGQLRVERDALGNIISKEIISLPESGNSLVLWLDFDLQKEIKVLV